MLLKDVSVCLQLIRSFVSLVVIVIKYLHFVAFTFLNFYCKCFVLVCI